MSFVGVVVDRPVITIDHGGGLRSSFEPVESTLAAGTTVGAGEVIGTAVPAIAPPRNACTGASGRAKSTSIHCSSSWTCAPSILLPLSRAP